MPELPEVETIRRSLAPHIVGRRVTAVDARAVRLRLGIAPGDWRPLEGALLGALHRHGKYLRADLGDVHAIIHLGMSGRLLLARPADPAPPHTHLSLCFEGGVELRLVDPRRFGMAVVLPARDLAAFRPLAELGVDALDGDIGGALRGAARRSRSPIRSLLLDQTVVAGLGNIYACEALFRAGIHPLRPAAAVAGRRVSVLADAIAEVLDAALAAGGTTLADGGFADAAGNNGYFAVQLGVYGRAGEPCDRCGSLIRRRVAGGRSVYYCSRCQR